jgi:hypothetical protein
MNTLIYSGVVIAGAITLLIEAHRNFNTSLTTIPFKEHTILKDMKVAQLCTSREKNFGFMFYSLLYLVTYAIILSSTEVYELVSQAARSNAEIGPTDALVGPNNDPFGLIGTQYGKPIFISAAIIAIFSLELLRPLESTMRSLSHRIAGVPRGVYNVIEDLHTIEFEAYAHECPTPLTNIFKTNAEASFLENHESDQVPTIKSALLTIDYLAPAITGKLRIQYFPFTQLDAMSDLSTKLEGQIAPLRASLKSGSPGEEADRVNLFNTSMAVANDTIALFAVHFLRNNRAIKNVKEKTVIAEVYKRIQRDYQIELNSFAMSLALSFVLAVGTATALYANWSIWKHPITQSALRTEVRGVLTLNNWEAGDVDLCIESDRPLFAFVQPDDATQPGNSTAPGGVTPADGAAQGVGAAEKLSPEKQRDCDGLWEQYQLNGLYSKIQTSLKGAFWNMISVALAVGLAAISAIFGRDVRREDNSWPEWRFRRVPFLRLASMAIVPAIVAVLGVTVGEFLKVWFDADFHLTENQIAFFFDSKSTFFGMHAFLGFIVAVSLLILIDQHDYIHVEISWLLGLLLGIGALMFYYIIILVSYPPGFIQAQPIGAWFPFQLRETLIYGAMPLFFLFLFAVFLELTEDRAKSSGSLILRAVRRRPSPAGATE